MTAATSANSDAGRRELAAAAEQVDDHREAGERQRKRDPDPAAHVLVEDVARPERDEQRAEVLDQQRDPDREPVDREEVEPLHEREPADPEDGEERQLATRCLEPRGRDRRAGRATNPTPRRVDRTSSSRSDERSEPRITFERSR